MKRRDFIKYTGIGALLTTVPALSSTSTNTLSEADRMIHLAKRISMNSHYGAHTDLTITRGIPKPIYTKDNPEQVLAEEFMPLW
jgi:hypothetical protein